MLPPSTFGRVGQSATLGSARPRRCGVGPVEQAFAAPFVGLRRWSRTHRCRPGSARRSSPRARSTRSCRAACVPSNSRALSAPPSPNAKRRFLEQEVAVGSDGRPDRDHVGVGVVVVAEDQAADSTGDAARVEELHPVAGRTAVGLDLVDLHRGLPQSLPTPFVEGGRGDERRRCRSGTGRTSWRRAPSTLYDSTGLTGGIEQPDAVGAARARTRTAPPRPPGRPPGATMVPAGNTYGRWVSSLSTCGSPTRWPGVAPGVDQLDPVARRAAVRFDLVDVHGELRAGSSLAAPLVGRGRRDEGAAPVGAAAVGRRRVSRPAVLLVERPVRIEQADTVGRAEAKDEAGFVHGQMAARCDGGARREARTGRACCRCRSMRQPVRSITVAAGVHQLDPVAGHAAARTPPR